MLSEMRTAVVLALAIGSGAFMLSQAEVFTWLRLNLLGRAKMGQPAWQAWKWIYKLVGCPYCLSVWMSLIASAIWNVRVVSYWYPLGWIATALFMTTIAMLGVLVIQKALGK